MRKPRDIDSELKALEAKAKTLNTSRVNSGNPAMASSARAKRGSPGASEH